jgi:hypothetical protein
MAVDSANAEKLRWFKMGKKNTICFEELDSHVQEIIIELIVSIIENKKKQKQEERES